MAKERNTKHIAYISSVDRVGDEYMAHVRVPWQGYNTCKIDDTEEGALFLARMFVKQQIAEYDRRNNYI
jgi:hypothetical protein